MNFKRKIKWRRGSASAMSFFYLSVLIVVASFFIVKYLEAYTSSLYSQELADSISNSAALAGDTGFGIDKKIADQAMKEVIKLNDDSWENYYEVDAEVTLEPYENDKDKRVKNVAHSIATIAVKDIATGSTISATTESKTKAIYTGGEAIMLLAYIHTYQYFRKSGYSDSAAKTAQTKYIWGAGRGDSGTGNWENYADCSSFVAGVYNMFGRMTGRNYNLPAYTGSLQTVGTVIKSKGSADYSLARPGDIILIWWDSSGWGDSDHAAIYAGRSDNGTDYIIDCAGGPQNNSILNAGRGASNGAIIEPAPRGCQIQINRIFDTAGNYNDANWKNYEVFGSMTGSAAAIARMLKALGFNRIGIAGALGSLAGESGFELEPTIVQGGSHHYYSPNDSLSIFLNTSVGYGIAQWTDTGRKTNLYNYARSCGKSVSDLDIQVSFLAQEINAWSGLIANMNSSGSPEAASYYWTENFEMPDEEHANHKGRAVYARMYYEMTY